MEDWLENDKEYLMNVYSRMPFAIKKAEGHYLEDINGDKFLDLFCGVGVHALGHRHPQILKAIQNQSEQYLHISNNFINPNATEYAKKLVKKTFGKGKVFFSNSGSEASETAIKLIHKWTTSLGEENRGVVVLNGSYHGRTLGALTFTRQEHVYQDFPGTSMPFYEVPINDCITLEKVITEHRPHAIMIETVLGAGGVYPLTQEFMSTIQNLCEEHSLLLIVDEVQTGFGRTGTLFSYEQTDLQPDIVIFAKACGGGLPLSGVIANAKTASLFKNGDHGTTFGPNPLSIASGMALFDTLMSSDAIENANNVSSFLHKKIQEIQEKYPQYIKEVRQRGMMFGIELTLSSKDAKAIQNRFISKGLLIDVTKGNVIRLLPPLTLTYVEAELFSSAFKTMLEELPQQATVLK